MTLGSVEQRVVARSAPGWPLASSGDQQLHVMTVGQRGDTGVERHQAGAVTASERQEVGIRHLSVSNDGWHVGVDERDVVNQEAVRARLAQRREDTPGGL